MPVRTPFFEVKLEGEDITPWVETVTVVEDDRQADSVVIDIPDPRMIYTDALFEGSEAEIDLGYADANQHALMLRAVITKVELNYPQGGVPLLKLRGEDRSIYMGLEEKRKLWRNMKVSEIVQAIARPYGFSRVVAEPDPDPLIEQRPLNQDGKTDLAFLQELATDYHAKCFVELDEKGQEVLYFIPERRVLRARRADRLLLRYRLGPNSNLISFSPSFDSSYIDRLKEIHDVDEQGNPVESQDRPATEVVIWPLDPARMAQANSRDRAKIQTLYTLGVARKLKLQTQLASRQPAVGAVTPDQADLESRNDRLESRQLGMSANGSTTGNIWLRAKSNIIVEGVSERFNGEWYVNNVTHKVDNNGYRTDFQCVR